MVKSFVDSWKQKLAIVLFFLVRVYLGSAYFTKTENFLLKVLYIKINVS